jgi:Kef-type K+ transport system membrane component KefB
VPRSTGYSLVGLLAGMLGVQELSPEIMREGRVLVDIALGLLLFELGSRFSLKWVRNNPWIVISSLCEAAFAFGAVWGLLLLFDLPAGTAVMAAAILMATSPAVVMQLRNELCSEGQVTERMLTLTALNSVYAIIGSKVALAWLHQSAYGNLLATFLKPVYLLVGSLFLAALLARCCGLFYSRLPIQREHGFVVLFGMLLVAVAVAHVLKLSSALTLLLAGALFKNMPARAPLGAPQFGSAGWMLTVILFAYTASVLRWQDVLLGGGLAVAAVIVRTAAKTAATLLSARRAGLDRRKGLYLGLTLAPISALAFVLVDDTYTQYPRFDPHLHAIITCSIVLSQIVFPWLACRALAYSNESRLHGKAASHHRERQPSARGVDPG